MPEAISADAASGALVLFSGGQDSTVCLAWALQCFKRVETIGFDYGQRHRIELDARQIVLERLTQLMAVPNTVAQQNLAGGMLGADHLVDLKVLGQLSDTDRKSVV